MTFKTCQTTLSYLSIWIDSTFFKCCYLLTGRSLIYSLFMFHIIYILPYVLMVKDNNTLINFSLHVNPIDGVDHLIRLQTRTFCLSRIHSWNACRFFFFNSPLPPYASITFSTFSSLKIASGPQSALWGTSWWLTKEKKEGKDRDSILQPLEWQSSTLTARPRHSPDIHEV